MMALTLTQPWASLVAIGAKQWETRSWPARFRGQLAIHAAKKYSAAERELATDDPQFRKALSVLPFMQPFDVAGHVIAVADLTDCQPTERFARERDRAFATAISSTSRGALPQPIVISDEEFAFGDYSDGRFAFKIERVLRLEHPIQCRGALGFWSLPDDVVARIASELATRRSA